jgi:hypothetical protein
MKDGLPTPAKSIGADLFGATRLEGLAKSNQLLDGRWGTSGASKELLKGLLALVGGGGEILRGKGSIRFEKVGHVDHRLKSRRNYVCALLGLWEVPKDVVDTDDRVLAGSTGNIDLLEVTDRFESTLDKSE